MRSTVLASPHLTASMRVSISSMSVDEMSRLNVVGSTPSHAPIIVVTSSATIPVDVARMYSSRRILPDKIKGFGSTVSEIELGSFFRVKQLALSAPQSGSACTRAGRIFYRFNVYVMFAQNMEVAFQVYTNEREAAE